MSSLDAAGESGAFVVEIERFQGPLDLLLHLIRRQDIDVFDIPIARITRQFLAAISGIQAHDLDSAGEFLEMAATLIRIKAQLLLPRPEEDEDEDPRAELVRRLLEYEQIREITFRLEGMEAERARRFRKGYLPPRPPPPDDLELEITWEDIWKVALALPPLGAEKAEHRVTGRSVSMDEKATLILAALRRGGGVEFRKLIDPFREHFPDIRMHEVMTFLAGLELTRRHAVLLRQRELFADLWIYPREGEGAAQEVAR